MWRRVLHVVIVAASCFVVSEAAAKKVALVIGIESYDHFSRDLQLRRPIDDARAVAAAFDAIGFETKVGENLRKREFTQLWERFLRTVAPGDIAAFFFAGHGLSTDRATYLLFRDTPETASERFLTREIPNAERLLKDLRARGAGAGVAILDTFRHNPYQPLLGGRRPLSPAAPPKGAFILYAASAGETALERLSNDDALPTSLFARELTRLMRRGGIGVSEMAQELKSSVRRLAAAFGRQQSPQYRDSLTETVCLAECAAAAPAITPAKAAQPAERFENDVLRITPLQSRIVKTADDSSALSVTLKIDNISEEVQGVAAAPLEKTAALYRGAHGRSCKLSDVHGLRVVRDNDDPKVLGFDAKRAKRSILPGSYITAIYRFTCAYVHSTAEFGELRLALYLVGPQKIRAIEAALSGVGLRITGS